jgi:hypothetical protein
VSGRACILRSLALAAALAPLGSCSQGPKAALHPVRGQVFVAGRPAVGASVVFHPRPAGPESLRPSGVVGEDGSFTLGTYAPGDGAPAGEYDVAIAWFGDRTRADPKTGEVPLQLSPQYADPTTSRLRATVKEGPNEIPAFKLAK